MRHALKYLHQTRTQGLHYWRTTPRLELDPSPPPPRLSSDTDDTDSKPHPLHNATTAHGMSNADWAACTRTRRSFTGSLIKLAGAAIAYKTKLQDTVATSSTESEFMAAFDLGKMLLYVRSVLWDLNVPQEAASTLYEDNDACTAMANAQKPTSRTQHMDIRYHVLFEWVERDLLILEPIDTSVNEADHFTKPLQRVLFHRHINRIMGHIPPAYTPSHLRQCGQFDQKIELLPSSFTTQNTMTPTTIPLDNDNKQPLTARAARIYSPLYPAIAKHPWRNIVALAA